MPENTITPSPATNAGSAAKPAETTSESPAVPTTNEAAADGRIIDPLKVEMKPAISTTKNQTSVKPASEDPSIKKLNETSDKPPVVSSVAQLRDAGLASGQAPTTEQVNKMREIETKNEIELGKQHRLPDAQQTGKK